MKLQNSEAKQNLVNRLKRIEGQVRGVAAMTEEERDCREIMQQLTSIRSALHGATLTFLEEYARQCLLDSQEDNPERREQMVEDLIHLLARAP